MPLEEAQYLPGQEQEDKAGAGGTPHWLKSLLDITVPAEQPAVM